MKATNLKNIIGYRNGRTFYNCGKKRRIYKYIPAGWRFLHSFMTTPLELLTICNGKSFFSGERKIAFIYK